MNAETKEPSPSEARAELAEAMRKHGVTIDTTFIPAGKVPADRAKDFPESITWEFSLKWHAGCRHSIRGLYSCGVGAAKYSRPSLVPKWNDNSVDAANFRNQLRASGKARVPGSFFAESGVLDPDPVDILSSLLLDASCGSQSFEDYCSEFGLDTDSRKAEKTWNACRETFVELVKLFGSEELSRLQAVASSL